jgi:hypothetical protein
LYPKRFLARTSAPGSDQLLNDLYLIGCRSNMQCRIACVDVLADLRKKVRLFRFATRSGLKARRRQSWRRSNHPGHFAGVTLQNQRHQSNKLSIRICRH